MGFLKKIILAIFVVYIARSVYKVHVYLHGLPPVPKLPMDQWWGPGKPKTVDESVTKFEIEFKPGVINELKSKLANAKYFTEPIEGVGFQYGFNNKYLKEVLDFWKNEYDFDARLKYMNQFPQYKTNIQGLDIHFVQIRRDNLKSGTIIIPLLLIHGWPGSFLEFYKTLPNLLAIRKDYNFVFDIIIPSIPGYAFSQGPSKSNLGEAQIAVIMKNLMYRLGYYRYMVQGGDWGAGIANNMAIMFPEDIIGIHTNFPVSFNVHSYVKMILSCFLPSFLIAEENKSDICPPTKILFNLIEESGYFHLQATKPDTIGVALRDSPAGLAAYILEKFSTWTNPEWKKLPDGGLTKKYSMTELLDNVMIYWISESITTSMRLYSESVTDTQYQLKIDFLPIEVPSAVAKFKNEVIYQTEGQIRSRYTNLIQLSVYEEGGHFAAFEEPKVFADDIWSATSKFRRYYEKIKPKTKK